MNGHFDPETLRLLNEAQEVDIETRQEEGSPTHRTIVWVVVMNGEVLVRSVRGPKVAGTARSRPTRPARCTRAINASRSARPRPRTGQPRKRSATLTEASTSGSGQARRRRW